MIPFSNLPHTTFYIYMASNSSSDNSSIARAGVIDLTIGKIYRRVFVFASISFVIKWAWMKFACKLNHSQFPKMQKPQHSGMDADEKKTKQIPKPYSHQYKQIASLHPKLIGFTSVPSSELIVRFFNSHLIKFSSDILKRIILPNFNANWTENQLAKALLFNVCLLVFENSCFFLPFCVEILSFQLLQFGKMPSVGRSCRCLKIYSNDARSALASNANDKFIYY